MVHYHPSAVMQQRAQLALACRANGGAVKAISTDMHNVVIGQDVVLAPAQPFALHMLRCAVCSALHCIVRKHRVVHLHSQHSAGCTAPCVQRQAPRWSVPT